MGKRANKNNNTAAVLRFLFVTFLLAVLAALWAVWGNRANDKPYDLLHANLESCLRQVSLGTQNRLTQIIGRTTIIRPATANSHGSTHESIPSFATIHLSLADIPPMVAEAGKRDLAENLANKLFNDFQRRFYSALVQLEHGYADIYREEFDKCVDEATPGEHKGKPPGRLTLSVQTTADRFARSTHTLHSDASEVIESGDPANMSAAIVAGLESALSERAEDGGYPVDFGIVMVGTYGGVLVCPTDGVKRKICIGKVWLTDPPTVHIGGLLDSDSFQSVLVEIVQGYARHQINLISDAIGEKSAELEKIAGDMLEEAEEEKGWTANERHETSAGKKAAGRVGFWYRTKDLLFFWK